MPTVTVTGAGTTSTLTYGSNDSAPYANTLSLALSAGLANGTLTAFPYTSGATAPGGPNGVAIIGSTTQVVTIPTSDVGIVVTGTASITGGAAGETVVGGSGGLTYTDITPSGSAVDYIAAGDGNNFLTTSTTGTGNYQINTGSGNDSISVFGNGVINAGTGTNSISVSGGNSVIYSEGHDNITLGSGTDTIDIGSGQATINPGNANVFIFAGAPNTNSLFVAPGTGSDTISVGNGGGTIYGGSAGNNILVGGNGFLAPGEITQLHGGGAGDLLVASSANAVQLFAGAGNETLTGAATSLPGGQQLIASTANNLFVAGTGSSTMVGGTGADTFQFSSSLTHGGVDSITGFGSNDTLQLSGYSAPTFTAAAGGGTVIGLSDGTQITVGGVSLTAASSQVNITK